MADTTIPGLSEIEAISGTALLVVDNGTQTFKITAQNLAESFQALTTEKIVQRLRGSGNFTVPAGVTEIRVRGVRTPIMQALTVMGESYGWSTNFEGNIGDGTADDRSSPVAVIGGHIFDFRPLFQGMTLKPDGTAWGIGANSYGQLGNGTFLNVYSPVPVLGNYVFDKIYADHGMTATVHALDRIGRAYSWGMNGDGRIGDGTIADRSSPVAVIGGHYFANIYKGSQTVYGLKTDGTLMAWGSPGGSGALGDGSIVNRSSPVAVIGGHKFVKVSPNGQDFNVYALKADGSVWAWGSGSGGRLGDGTVFNRSSPVAVIGGHVFIDVVGHGNGAYALKADGSVWSWGLDNNGSNGIGLANTAAYRSSPVAVIGGHSFKRVQISPYGTFPMALKEDGTAWSWGDGGETGSGGAGANGTGTTTPYSSPVAVIGGHKFDSLYCQPNQTYFLKRDGSMWAAGVNGGGNLGDGTLANRSSPVAVIGGYKFGRQLPTREGSIRVTAGDVMPFSSHMGYFGPFYVGRDMEEIELEYWAE